MSSRRVKKGPGRRPQSAKRQRFTELRARGWSGSAAAREVGVSRSSGTNWTRGYKTYRNGEVVGFVAPLDRLEAREVSARYRSPQERFTIADVTSASWPLSGHCWYNVCAGFGARLRDSDTDFAVKPCSNSSTAEMASA